MYPGFSLISSSNFSYRQRRNDLGGCGTLEKICLVFLSMCGGQRLFPTILFAIGALPEPAAHSFELSNSSFYVDAGDPNTQVFMLAR